MVRIFHRPMGWRLHLRHRYHGTGRATLARRCRAREEQECAHPGALHAPGPIHHTIDSHGGRSEVLHQALAILESELLLDEDAGLPGGFLCPLGSHRVSGHTGFAGGYGGQSRQIIPEAIPTSFDTLAWRTRFSSRPGITGSVG